MCPRHACGPTQLSPGRIIGEIHPHRVDGTVALPKRGPETGPEETSRSSPTAAGGKFHNI